MRTQAQIKKEITDSFMANEALQSMYGFDPNISFELQFSLVSIENIWFEIVAAFHFILERLFDEHRTETHEYIASQKSHRLPQIRQRLLDFQYGFGLKPGTDEWSNGNASEETIEASKIIKYAAVVESQNESRVICKIATETGGELSPIEPTEFEAVNAFVKEIKPPGVPYTVINYLPDLLRLNIRIFRDPLVLTGGGVHRVTGLKPVEIALSEFMKELPFDGELRLQDLANKLENTEGVSLVQIDSAETAWLDAGSGQYGDYTAVDVRVVPESGYFKIEDYNGISYVV
jgi:hypothetical protein